MLRSTRILPIHTARADHFSLPPHPNRQSVIHAEGFRSLGEGETVEFSVDRSEEGRAKAVDVSGPEGAFVQGAPRRPFGGGRGPPGPPRATGEDGERVSTGLQVVVHNLPWSYTWHSLKDLFKEVGDVQRADVIYGEDNRSKGFGTICFATKEEAEAAIEKFHDSEVDGRTISVRIDQYA